MSSLPITTATVELTDCCSELETVYEGFDAFGDTAAIPSSPLLLFWLLLLLLFDLAAALDVLVLAALAFLLLFLALVPRCK